MTISLFSAVDDLPNRTTVSSLFELMTEVSATAKDAIPGDTYLLFSGKMPDGTRTNEIAAEIISQATVNVHDIGDTDVGKLLSDSRFATALNKAVAKEYFMVDIADATLSQIEQIRLKSQELMSGIDDNHNRISNTSLWDFASHSYVAEAEGNFRIIAPTKLDDLSVFVQSELPALLDNPKITLDLF